MAEESANEAQQSAPTTWEEAFPDQTPESVRTKLGHAREWESRSKKHWAELKRLSEVESNAEVKEKELTAKQKEILDRATAFENEAIRERAARKHGLDDDLMPFLTGETEAEVDAKAKLLSEKLVAPASTGPVSRRDPSQGSGASTALNGDSLLRDIKLKLGIH